MTDPNGPAPVGGSFTVEAVSHVSNELVEAFAALIPQLSSSAPAPSAAELRAIAESPSTTLFVCRSSSGRRPVVGTLTLVLYRIPTGVRAVIEDVVVDSSARGGGAASALVEEALRSAYAAGASRVDLTSRPARAAANGLYLRLGFEKRETNVYRHRRP